MQSLRLATLAVLFAALFPAIALAQRLTAADTIQRYQQHYAVPPPADTVDTIKAGDPSTPVTGIAVTFLDTMDVLREANRRGLNLVISHEPTFYNHLDNTAFFTDDPVYREKLAFIQQNHMVVVRFHDQLHRNKPDPVRVGLVQALGWERYLDPADPGHITIPRTTLLDLARDLEKKLNVQSMRVVGNPALAVTRVGLMPGAAGTERQITMLRSDTVEVLLVGEVPEWETVEYVRDASAQGRAKALIMLGHAASEEPGMSKVVDDLHALFPNLPVALVPAKQPTWNPEYPPAPAPATQPAR